MRNNTSISALVSPTDEDRFTDSCVFVPDNCILASDVVPIGTAAGAFLTAASMTAKAVIEQRGAVRRAEIEAETARQETVAETERTRIRETAETERERLRRQSLPAID